MAPAKSDTSNQDSDTGNSEDIRHHQVSHQISDAVSQVNVSTIGVAPAYATLQAMMAQSQAQGVLMANMVSGQRQLSMTGMATLTKSVEQMMSRRNR
ncbi:RebB family R body protein [Thalassospira alkalitolerans]|uniref:RebB family R body protein n=1 Tax=Thalassospira alkalitolerans TaxID=1293890 RepID=UPI000A1EA541|nr:RebB family R body protein [Thalassospira alkalitolerans]|tara:strand:+ start:61078 stop:61368 length:291 start_codon:yes stop_codon:yes gene_type:complete